ncbi:Sugar transporter [Musa troglodytarum]|uniref:H(+)/Pi cotransporter n=1 Tax=Musa troglodytarum TaxID=320322 RepID=A0A9E7F2I6_9LILI|nr:Sugar transporter [Musa troglodytarum]
MAQQLQVLSALDAAKTQWYHFTAIVIAGMGFFTDAYDLFCISLVTKLLGRIYYHVDGSPNPGTLPPQVSSAVNGVAFVGTLSGQLFFGWLGDKLGRKRVYGMTLMLMVLCSVASGLSFGHSPKGVMATLCFFRFWLGFGIGGDYPLSATIMSEYANKKTRGAFIAAVFAMQGLGILAGGMVTIAVSTAFKNRFQAPPYAVDPAGSTVPEADYVWRLILMFGSLPAALTYYWRLKMPETARYTALVAKDAKQAASDMSKLLQVEIEEEQSTVEQIAKSPTDTFGLFSKEFLRRHGLHLLGTTTTWFLLDIAFYSQNLFQKDIFSAIGWIPKPATMNALEEVFRIARAQTLIALCGTVPGYWFTVALIDVIGRFTIQVLGFFMMTAFMLGLAIPYQHWTTKGNHIGFIVMYAFTFFFANFGPNSTTFIVPAEIFPARLRSTCHGISAASGKLGAIVGSFGFLYLAQNQDPAKADRGYRAGIGVRNSLFLLAGCSLLGLACSFLVPESKGKSLEEIKPPRHASKPPVLTNEVTDVQPAGPVTQQPTESTHLSPWYAPGRVSYATWTLRSRSLQTDGQCGILGLNPPSVNQVENTCVASLGAARFRSPPRRTSPSVINGVDRSSRLCSLVEQLDFEDCLHWFLVFYIWEMKCFPFLNGASKVELEARFSASVRSNSTASTECNVRRSGPEFNTRDVSSIGADSMGRSLYPCFSQIPSNLRVFTFSELRNATRNFSRSLMVGEGGFGCVYRGTIKSFKDPNMRIEIAVKQLNHKGLQASFLLHIFLLSQIGHREWLNEVNVLGVVEHPNLVKLIGYCAEDDERGIQRLLVYEYMPNGSVEDHLSPQCKRTLSWSMRLRVALDSARGLAYLHEQMEFQIIFRDFKSSNILLDKDWNAKLSDFGLARQGPTEGISHVSTAVVGTLGYAAPEYMQTGRLTAKSDIWSYGVFLYELLTGRQPIDIDRPKGEQKLLEWVKPYISDVKKFRIIMDTRLAGEYSFKSATKLASVANRCLRQQPKSRPKMSEVLEMVQQIVGSTGAGVPQAPLRNSDLEQGHPRLEKKKGLRRTIGEQKKGQGMQLAWQGCRSKLVKSC